MIIYLRSETHPNETRSALVPEDITKLISSGFKVYVEASPHRIFPDSDFVKAGAILTREPWYSHPSDIIIGLKELRNLDMLDNHTHIYFSHSFKGQKGSQQILDAFTRSSSRLYDLEYFCREGKRVLAFGFYAGLVGAVLGIRQHYNRLMGLPDLSDLKPWPSMNEMLDFCKYGKPRIGIIGNGRCSNGVQHVLKIAGLSFDLLDQNDPITLSYDIFFNCILLSEDYTKVWINETYTKNLLIVDISCDYTKKNNPIPIYKKGTTWSKPVLRVSDQVSVIAIDNLPSLLPADSSREFSKDLSDLFLNFQDPAWLEAEIAFSEAQLRSTPTNGILN